MNLLLLCAGFATRLYPLTRDRAKPLLEVGGRPVLDHLMERLAGIELERGVLVHNARFAEDFRAWAATEPAPVPLETIDDGALDDEHKLGGIADLALGLRRLEQLAPGRPVLVLAGDNLIEFPLAPHAERFRVHEEPLVLARELEELPPPRRYGEITADAEGRVLRFREKPERPESRLAATCLYFLPAGILGEVETYLGEGGDPDAPGHFVGWLSRRRTVRVSPFTGTLWDIGDRASLDACRRAHGDPG